MQRDEHDSAHHEYDHAGQQRNGPFSCVLPKVTMRFVMNADCGMQPLVKQMVHTFKSLVVLQIAKQGHLLEEDIANTTDPGAGRQSQ